MITVLYPIPPKKKSPIEAVKRLPVTVGGKNCTDAAACEIRFNDGRIDRLMIADQAGTLRRYADTETAAMVHGTTIHGQQTATFTYPK